MGLFGRGMSLPIGFQKLPFHHLYLFVTSASKAKNVCYYVINYATALFNIQYLKKSSLELITEMLNSLVPDLSQSV